MVFICDYREMPSVSSLTRYRYIQLNFIYNKSATLTGLYQRAQHSPNQKDFYELQQTPEPSQELSSTA